MKITHFIQMIVFAGFVAACNDPATQKIVGDVPKVAIDKSLENPLAGTWVNKAYVDTLLLTKSPMASQGSELFYSIPLYLGDTGYTFVFHEGGQQFVVKETDSKYMLYLASGDSSLIEQVRDGCVKIAGDEYVRISKERSENVSEQFLFAADFKKGDTLVHFGKDGVVSGLDTVVYYSIQNDYQGPGLDRDLMTLGESKTASTTFSFYFSGDTLRIYSIKCSYQDENGDCVEIENDQLCYQLIRKK